MTLLTEMYARCERDCAAAYEKCRKQCFDLLDETKKKCDAMIDDAGEKARAIMLRKLRRDALPVIVVLFFWSVLAFLAGYELARR